MANMSAESRSHLLMPLQNFLPCTAAEQNVRELFPNMLRGSQGYLRARTIIFPAIVTQIFPSPHAILASFCICTR